MSGKRLLTRWRIQPYLRVGFFASALLFLMADDGIGPDEFQCELAVGHLIDCCPGLPANLLSCTHGGCESNLTPDLQMDRSLCLQQKSCEQLVAAGACDVETWETVARPTCMPSCSAKVPLCQ